MCSQNNTESFAPRSKLSMHGPLSKIGSEYCISSPDIQESSHQVVHQVPFFPSLYFFLLFGVEIKVSFFKRYNTKRFAELLGVLHGFISVHLHQHALYTDPCIEHASRFMKLLCTFSLSLSLSLSLSVSPLSLSLSLTYLSVDESNEEAHLVHYSEFYNSAVCGKVNFKEDYKRWMSLRYLY